MSRSGNVWIIDDDKSIRWVLDRALTQAGPHPRVFDSGESIMMRLEHEQPDAIISDIRMPGVDGITLLMMASGCSCSRRIMMLSPLSNTRGCRPAWVRARSSTQRMLLSSSMIQTFPDRLIGCPPEAGR